MVCDVFVKNVVYVYSQLLCLFMVAKKFNYLVLST